jgi:hypothetical protein
MYVQEYLWTVLQPLETDRVTLVLDLKGLAMSTLSNREIVGMVKACVSMTSTHYPQRSHKMIIANVPSWFSMIFSIVQDKRLPRQRGASYSFSATLIYHCR